MTKQPRASAPPNALRQFLIAGLLLFVGFIDAPAPATAQGTDRLEASHLTRIEQYVIDVTSNPTTSEADKKAAEQILETAHRIIDQSLARQETLRQHQDTAGRSDAILADLAERAEETLASEDLLEREDDPNLLQNRLSLLLAERASLTDAEAALLATKAELTARSEVIAKEIVAARQILTEASPPSRAEQLETLAPLEAAKSVLNELERDAQAELIRLLQDELATLPARQKIVSARLVSAGERSQALDKAVDTLRARLGKTQLGIAENYVLKARLLKQGLSGDATFLDTAASENLRLAEGLRTSVESTGILEHQVRLHRSEILSLKQSVDTVEQVLGTGTLTNEMAALLRELRSGLQTVSELRQQAAAAEKARIESQLGLIVLQDSQRRLSDTSGDVFKLLKLTPPKSTLDPATIAMINRSAEEIAQARLDILNAFLETGQTEQRLRVDQSLAINEILELTSKLSVRLDRRFLFMRTSESVNPDWLEYIVPGLIKIFSPTAWQGVLKLFLGTSSAIVGWIALAFLPPLGIWLFRDRLLTTLEAASGRVGHVETDDYWTTPVALLTSLALALPWPWFVGSLGLALLSMNEADTDFTLALGQALVTVSSILLIFTICRVMARRNGVLAVHFGWSELARLKTRRLLSAIAIIFGISSFFFVLAMMSNDPELRYGVGITSFLIISLTTAFLSYEIFKPNGGIAASIDPRTPASAWLVLALPMLVGAPLVNGAMPLFGFLDTGLALQERVLLSVSYFVVTATIYCVAMRMFQVASRRIAQRANSERQAIIAARQSETTEVREAGDAVPVIPDNPHDAELIGNQVRSILLLTTGLLFLITLWFVWRTIIPALGIADEFVLWSSGREVGDQIIQTPVTLWNFLVALGLAIGGFILARNLKGVLEVGLFQRLGLDVGARYAAVTMAGYVIAGAGLVFGSAQLGLDWSKLQWIVAAFGVGLGFGLQEVLANFVSGLIILFERPIRVGDTVTIGDLTGTVSEIKIRATTITDFDNREVLLPNKTIITQNVSNWTLHNNVTRIVIPIGVAYGSDIDRVRSLLLSIARGHPDVLSEPQPTVFFMAHAESSLDFELRVFVASILKRFPVRHELNTAINKTLRENGIEIPFPQRDLHLKQV